MSTAQDLPGLYGEPLHADAPLAATPALRLVPAAPLDFDDAVRRVRPRLHRYAIRRLGDSHEAEELVQEALLRAYTHREQLLTEEDLSAWATVVTGRLVIDRLRVRGRSTSVADVPEGSRVGRDTAEVVVARDEARTALDALDAMPTRQASLLWAREVEGKSYDELCTQFEMTEPAVRSVLTRARKALRKEYELRGGTVPVGGLAVLAPWITGLTWADKLRRAANKLTAPAVLGAAGIAALGGLVLSPFGAAPAPSTSTFSPAQSIVVVATQPATQATAGSVSAPTASAPRVATAGTSVTPGRDTLTGVGSAADDTCVEVQGKAGTSGAGGYGCRPTDTDSKHRFVLQLPTAVPDNPLTGPREHLVIQTDLDCTRLTSPVTQCDPQEVSK